MIDERMEEQASLYLVGALTAEERRQFENEIESNPELKALVAKLSSATAALAGVVPKLEPPAALKQRILDQLPPKDRVLPMPAPAPRSMSWIPWALAAALAVVCAVLLGQATHLRSLVTEQEFRLNTLAAMAQNLQMETNHLQADVTALRETNRLSHLRIAMLSSMLATEPKTVAVTLWDSQSQDGVFVVHDLKPLPEDRDYQLWVIDPDYKTPVDAGVFRVDAEGNVRIIFKAKLRIRSANKFAVTEEPKGGLPTPTMKNLVLLGG